MLTHLTWSALMLRYLPPLFREHAIFAQIDSLRKLRSAGDELRHAAEQPVHVGVVGVGREPDPQRAGVAQPEPPRASIA